MNYLTLIGGQRLSGSIQQWVNHSRLPSESIIEEAQAWIYRRLRVPEMQQIAEGTIGAGEDTIPLPARFLSPRSLWIVGINRLRLRHLLAADMERGLEYDLDGARVWRMPLAFTVGSGVIRLDAPSDAVYPFRFAYYGEPERLSRTNQTNFLTERYPSMFRWVCLAFAHEYLKDWPAQERLLALAMGEIQNANTEAASNLAGVEATARVMRGRFDG